MDILKRLHANRTKTASFTGVTYGRVVDTNDPQQMGRLRVFCPALSDTQDKKLKNIPWATYISPLAGITEKGSRGRGDDVTVGPVAYGMWNIPKIGSTVLIACVDGDTSVRIWLGCIHNQLLAHTMPHGRYLYQDGVADFSESFDDVEAPGEKPLGPLSTQEAKIEPLFSQLELAFTPGMDTIGTESINRKPFDNYEWRTRGADHSVSGLTEKTYTSSSQTAFSRDDADMGDGTDTFTDKDGNKLTSEQIEQGYKRNRILPDLKFNATEKNYDSQVYSWTTPGFHAMAMDDSPSNCRIRFRTTHGHQIILDDTNERIYISTSGGKTWVELDEKGNMDFYAERNISFHAVKDINFTTDDTFRVKAKNGIHLISEGEMRLHAINNDIHIKSDKNINIRSDGNLGLVSDGRMDLTVTKVNKESLYLKSIAGTVQMLADTEVKMTATNGTLDIKSGSDMKITSSKIAHIKGTTGLNLDAGSGIANLKASSALSIQCGGNMALDGSTINLNSGGTAGNATDATPADAAIASMTTLHKNAFWTNRVPEHEPWPRVMTKAEVTDQDADNTHADSTEYPYDDPNVGRKERGTDLERNKNWHR